jgi:hypothetical protein
MNYIEEQKKAHRDYLNRYSLTEIESAIADSILEDAKHMIRSAIADEKNSATFFYSWDCSDGGSFDFYRSNYPSTDYLKSNLWGLHSLAACFKRPSVTLSKSQRQKRDDLVQAIYENEKKLDLATIEKRVHDGVMALGVKNCEAHVKFIDHYIKKTKKKILFFDTYDEEKVAVNKYKVYCHMSW